MEMQSRLRELFNNRVHHFVSNSRGKESVYPKAEKKKESLAKREAEIVKVNARGKMIGEETEGDIYCAKFMVHFQYVIKQKSTLYIEEEIEMRMAKFYKDDLIYEDEISPFNVQEVTRSDDETIVEEDDKRYSFQYNRLKAVQYAERWWNSYNPAYKKFDVDCTNFISQCLCEGGAPMTGYPNRSRGWWIRNNNWSYSWAVANSLKFYLNQPNNSVRAREVSSPNQLLVGDVICYDFQGDGRFDHNTIVTGKDAFGMPLVNAHTYNSRKRYWAYEDSTAYTPRIKYKFYTIAGGN